MAEVRPFRGLRYNSDIVGSLSDIIAPPFDTISPELQESLYSRSPHNVVRLEAGKRLPADTPSDNRYTRTASLLREWLRGNVLQREDSPCFYLVRHAFTIGGQPTSRLELMAAVGLAEYDERVVLPHENTRDADKEDRLALISAARANISPIMCLYRDPSGEVPAVLADVSSKEPLAEFIDVGVQEYAMWRLEDPADVERIQAALSDRPLYIADGHHRYETALNYRRAMSEESAASRPAPWDFVMMGLVDFDDLGLRVLPYHRTLLGLDQGGLERMREQLKVVFEWQPVDGVAGLAGLEAKVGESGKGRLSVGLYDPAETGLNLLTFKNTVHPVARGPLAQSEAWILERHVLNPVLGEALGLHVDYVHDLEEMERRAGSGECQMGFLLKPFPLDLFETVMDQGLRLPPKSTFFFPKLATGLVMNPLHDAP